jgi:allantoinase
MGEKLRGAVKATYLRGEPIYQNGLITDTPHGRELTLS